MLCGFTVLYRIKLLNGLHGVPSVSKVQILNKRLACS